MSDPVYVTSLPEVTETERRLAAALGRGREGRWAVTEPRQASLGWVCPPSGPWRWTREPAHAPARAHAQGQADQ